MIITKYLFVTNQIKNKADFEIVYKLIYWRFEAVFK